MAGPWEKYQKKKQSGPWEKYVHEPEKPEKAASELQPIGEIRAEKPPSGMAESIERSSRNFIADLQHGTTTTKAGEVLHRMGLQPLHGGQPEAVGELMGSVPLGAARLLKGHAETMQEGKRWQGVKDIAGGASQMMELPSLFMAPEAKEAATAVIPTTGKAGKLLQQLERVVGKVPIDVNLPGNSAMKIQEMAESGATMPKVVRNFLTRVTRPGVQPLTYSEGRKFYENATRLSFDEMNRLTPQAKRMVGEFTRSLDKSLQRAAETKQMGQAYSKAMSSYHRAARLRDFARNAGPAALKAGAAAVGAGAGYKVYKSLSSLSH